MNIASSALFALISGAVGFLIGGIFVDGVTSVLALVALITGLSTVAAREAAVLLGGSEEAVKHATAWGFFAGAGASALILSADALWG